MIALLSIGGNSWIMPPGTIKQHGMLNAMLNFMVNPNVKFAETQAGSSERFPTGFAPTGVLD